MLASVECVYCGGLNVVDFEVELIVGEVATLRDVRVRETMTFDEFLERYRKFVYDIAEFPIEKNVLLQRIKRFFNCSTALAYDILDRLKLDLGLYEKNGMIYSTDEYL